MFARMALPLLGGAPAVWNTAVVFFQATLLAGYAYAHASTAWLGPRRQIALQLGLALVALGLLPIGIPRGSAPPPGAAPAPWLLSLMVVAVGLPFFVVATGNPVLQKWFAGTGHDAAADPYFLYVPSNLGSLLALVSYPVLLEPRLTLPAQSRLWTLGYVTLLGLLAFCAASVWRPADAVGPSGPRAAALAHPREALPVTRRLRWALLAFAPSSLMLSVTTHLATEVAAIPLFWVLPLALYLLTFALAFARWIALPHRLTARLLPLLVLPLAMLLAGRANEPVVLLIPLHLATLFVAAMVCHGELARDRPPARHLTAFYLWMSVGGVLGGVFNALVAPLIFPTILEYPLTLVLVCLLGPSPAPTRAPRRQRALDMILPVALGAVTGGLVAAGGAGAEIGPGLMFGLPAALCLVFARRPIRFGLGLAAILAAGLLYVGQEGRVLHGERSFFGVHRVTLDPTGGYHLLLHGSTLHGMQSLDPARRLEPLAYFDATGPLGQLFAVGGPPPGSAVAVVGLGTGSVACHGAAGQRWTFYEIDPAVARIARDPRYFTFLRDCPPEITVVLGDARRSLGAAPDRHYALIILDAYSGDAPPVHLLTREALRLYLDKLAPGGLLVFHLTNRHLDLAPVLAALAQDSGLISRVQDDLAVGAADRARGKTPSRWLVMVRHAADLGPLGADPRWARAPPASPVVWTDEFSSLLPTFVWPGARSQAT